MGARGTFRFGNMANRKKKKKLSFGSIVVRIFQIVCLGIFIFSAWQLFGIISEYRAGEKEYEGLQQYVQFIQRDQPDTDQKISHPDALAAEALAVSPVTVDFLNLRKVNEDIVGWIYAEAVPEISYPVVQGEDNEYYLYHTVEKKKNTAASIFLDFAGSPDFSDAFTVVYGHNMKNKSMFGRLKSYREQEIYDQSPYLWILTPEADYRYEIFSVCTVSANDKVYDLSFMKGEESKGYLEKLQQKSEVKNTMILTENEPVLMLSTCTGNDSTRCVVLAVRAE